MVIALLAKPHNIPWKSCQAPDLVYLVGHDRPELKVGSSQFRTTTRSRNRFAFPYRYVGILNARSPDQPLKLLPPSSATLKACQGRHWRMRLASANCLACSPYGPKPALRTRNGRVQNAGRCGEPGLHVRSSQLCPGGASFGELLGLSPGHLGSPYRDTPVASSSRRLICIFVARVC